MVLNAAVFIPLIEFTPEKALDIKTGRGKKQQQPCYVSDKTRGKQNDAGYENKQSVYHFFGRHKPLLQALPDPQHGFQPLHACQGGACKPGEDDDRHRIESTQEATQFDYQINFGDRNKRER